MSDEKKPYDAPEGVDTESIGGISGGAADVQADGIKHLAETSGQTVEELKEAVQKNVDALEGAKE